MRKAFPKFALAITLATIWSLFLLLCVHQSLPATAWAAAKIIVGAFEMFAVSLSLYMMWREVTGGESAPESQLG